MRDADILNRVDGVDMKNDTPYAGGGGGGLIKRCQHGFHIFHVGFGSYVYDADIC